MKNKTIAILGIISYILTVLSSAQDDLGNYTSPQFLVLISGIMTFIFVILATKRLWKTHIKIAVVFISSFFIRSIFESLMVNGTIIDGSFIILFYSLTKVVYLITFFVVVIKLLKNKDK